jgi:ribosomal protein S18 acetylase RimI-like enzyme
MLKRPVFIREAEVEDIQFLQAMIWEGMLASPIFLAHHGVEAMQRAEEEYWRRWKEQPDPAFVAIDAGGQKLGAITMKPDDREVPVQSWRIGIGVEKEARGQGIGRSLIERTITEAKARGANFVTLFVDPSNTIARTLYEHMGFATIVERDETIKMQIKIIVYPEKG